MKTPTAPMSPISHKVLSVSPPYHAKAMLTEIK